MRRIVIMSALLAASTGAAVAVARETGPAADESQSARGVRGAFNLQAMMHQSTAEFPVLPGVSPWDGRVRRGRFAYRSIPCRGNAPINNVSSNLPSYNAKVSGSRVPSSTRLQPFRFRVVRTKTGPEIRGGIRLTVCKLAPGPTANPDPIPDAGKPKISIAFRAPYRRETAESVSFAGTFRVAGGTQRYQDLTGSGTIRGYLFCLGPEPCASRGGTYRDGQISLQGVYRDPTPQLQTP